MNIFILDKNYNQIGMLSNEGANPQAPYFDDLYTQELDTGADTFYFTTLSTSASRDFIEIGNHIIFQFNNRHRLFAISDLEFEHKEGRNVIGVYAEGVGFQLLETFMGEFEGGDDTNGDGKVDKEDEGEGEFMTYDMFLEKVLKDTDWNYQIMSGDLTNINMGREVRFSNGKNIYALLQDSMQEFGGVELEFRAEYVGGGLNKTVYAYPHKGRGSFVGQRFEYGHNVAGIKKKQEVVDYMDENIILYEGLETVDGLNTEVTYEVDFALRGYEVEELEIGDTHYVIDNDFEPAQFEARIGKIEISFSDPTKNKCYIANFKKISGSKPDNIDSDNVEDIIEDNLDDKLDELIDDKLGELIGDDFKNHTHDRLVSENDGSKTPLVFKSGHGFMADNNSKWHMAHLVNSDIGLNFGATDAPDHWTSVYIERSSSLANGAKKTATIFTSDGNMLPDTNNQYIGASDRRWKAIYSNYIDAANSVSSPRYFGYNYQVRFDRDDMQNVTKVTDKQDLLDFIVNKVNVYKYSSKTIDDVVGAPDKISYQEYYGLLAEDFTTHSSSTDCGGSEVAYNIMKNLLTDDTNGDGEINGNDGHNKHTYNLPALVTTLIGAFQQHVENGGEDGSNIDLSAYATKTYVNDAIDDIEVPDLSDYATKKYVDDAIKAIELETGTSIKSITINSSNHLIFTLSDGTTIDAGELPSGSSNGGSNLDSAFTYYPANGHDSIYFWKEEPFVQVHGGILMNRPLVLFDDESDEGWSSSHIQAPAGIFDYIQLDTIGDGEDTIRASDLVKLAKGLGVDSAAGTGILTLDGLRVKFGATINNGLSVRIIDSLEKPPSGSTCAKPSIEFDYTQVSGEYVSRIRHHASRVGIDGMLSAQSIMNYSDESLKENIRYLDSETTPDVGEGDIPDFLVKADLHDFIINQINLCEYNFIDDDSPKIGFIADEYEGTKVGNKIVSSHELEEHDDNGEVIETTKTLAYDVNNLLFATIGALQEEVRIKDEKIASLEARLARIEEMLNNN